MRELCDAMDGLMSDVFSNQHVRNLMEEFDNAHSPNPNFRLWTSYTQMVELLLALLAMIRAHRDGNWDLHLESFAAMLPWVTIYDTNYARWGPVYLAGMENLETKAPKVHAEFIAGTNKRFNQVPADQATEWMNKTCKVQNSIIGIKPETSSASPGQNGLVSRKAPDVSSALKMTRKR